MPNRLGRKKKRIGIRRVDMGRGHLNRVRCEASHVRFEKKEEA